MAAYIAGICSGLATRDFVGSNEKDGIGPFDSFTNSLCKPSKLVGRGVMPSFSEKWVFVSKKLGILKWCAGFGIADRVCKVPSVMLIV